MSPDSTIRSGPFFKRNWALLLGIGVLASLAAIVAVSLISVTIKSYPSCVSYQSERNAPLGGRLRASFGHYLAANGFTEVSSGSEEAEWDSRTSVVRWGSDSILWLTVCTKTEKSSDWLDVAQGLQALALRAHWAPEAFLQPNPDVTGRRTANTMRLDYPVDFKKLTPKTSMVRIANETGAPLQKIRVNGISFGDLSVNGVSGYKALTPAYRYASLRLEVAGQEYESIPDDYVGETPLGNGNFTYGIRRMEAGGVLHFDIQVRNGGTAGSR